MSNKRRDSKMILKIIKSILIILISSFFVCAAHSAEKVPAGKKVQIKAIGIPLADHYAGIVAFEKYRGRMKHADYQLLLLPGPELVRAYFYSEPDADIAYNVCPMVMDMFAEKPNFRWVSLIHRDGNALAINNVMNTKVKLTEDKLNRKPDGKIASAFRDFKNETGKPVECAIPSPLATHTTALYKYLKDHNRNMSFTQSDSVNVVAVVIKPPRSPAFLKKKRRQRAGPDY